MPTVLYTPGPNVQGRSAPVDMGGSSDSGGYAYEGPEGYMQTDWDGYYF